MAINFAAASTAGLNNPGTEIIKIVKDESGNFINPPSYDKIRAYLRSGEVPMLFVTTEGGETGSLYQLDGYSETENKIRFSNDTNAIEFCAGCEVPNVVEISSGGGSADFVINGTFNSNMEVTLDKTFAQIQAAIQEGKHPAVHITGMLAVFLPLVGYDTDFVTFAAVGDVSTGTITSIGITITNDAILFDRSPSPALNSDGALIQFPMEADPISPMEIATKKYVDNKECILKSTTPGSTKKFKITVDDSGTISATEVT